jgi:uncharacterized repeat protein (TIGR03803 family)/autotransporter-associated beta strand protein
MSTKIKRLLPGAAICVAAAASPVLAQQYTLTTLASFNDSDGGYPTAGLVLSGGTLYGTAVYGGSYGYGDVYSVPTTGGTPTALGSFNFNNGLEPASSLTLSGNTLFGTTQYGGSYAQGVVFAAPITGGTPTAQVSFNGGYGEKPQAGLIVSGNTLYGTTSGGGAYSAGTVFSAPVTGGTPTVLASFNGSNGQAPSASLILSGNTLYGTTAAGGAYGDGAVFSVPVTGGTPTVLASFNGSNGQAPSASLLLSGGTLYGTTASGGADGAGEVFAVPIIGGTPKVLASFNYADGYQPSGNLILSGNTLFGTTQFGGSFFAGEIFAVPIIGGTPNVLASFGNGGGRNPSGGLLLSGNTFYGTTQYGGSYAAGTVYELNLPILYWNNASNNGQWDINTSANWNDVADNLNPITYAESDFVLFDDAHNTSGNYNVTLNTTVNPGSIIVNNSAGNYVISGTGSIAGSTSLIKEGTSSLMLDTANSFTGATTIYGGTLALCAAGSIADSVTINVDGGATFDISAVSGGFVLGGSTAQELAGTGTVQGNVTVGAEGNLSPGDAIGPLTVNGVVTLGGTFSAQVDPDISGSNDQLITGNSGNVVLGGALNVTASNSDPFTAGSSYTLISAAGGIQNGPGVQTVFSSVSLPALNPGLSWDTTLLNDNRANYQNNYTISVTSSVPAGFTLGNPIYTAALTPGQSYKGYYIQNLGGQNTDVQFLDGTVNAGTTLAVQFANRSGSNPDLISDAVTINGTNSDRYVLELNYSSLFVTNGTLSPVLAVENNNVFEAAVLLDPTQHEVAGAYNPSTDDVLGDYGIDPTNHEVWAVLDYSGGDEFGVYQRIPGDLTGGGTVTPSDLGLVQTNLFGSTGGLWSNGDFQGNGSPTDTVTPSDLALVQTNLFAIEPTGGSEGAGGGLITSSPVPEPGSLALLAVGGIGLLVRRHRVKRKSEN